MAETPPSPPLSPSHPPVPSAAPSQYAARRPSVSGSRRPSVSGESKVVAAIDLPAALEIINDLEETIASQQGQVMAYSKRLALTEGELAALKNAKQHSTTDDMHGGGELDRVLHQLRDAQSELSHLRLKISNGDRVVSSLKSQLAERREIDQLQEARIDELEGRLRDAENECFRIEEERRAAEKQWHASEQGLLGRIDLLTTQLENATGATDKVALQDEVSFLRQAILEKDKELKALSDRMTAQKSKRDPDGADGDGHGSGRQRSGRGGARSLHGSPSPPPPSQRQPVDNVGAPVDDDPTKRKLLAPLPKVDTDEIQKKLEKAVADCNVSALWWPCRDCAALMECCFTLFLCDRRSWPCPQTGKLYLSLNSTRCVGSMPMR